MGLRIGIDVGGTFTHGVVLQPPGAVIAKARTPTTHTDQRGVAAGVEEVLRLLLDELGKLGRSKDEVELVAHSTTQATNALLEGDLSGVHLLAIVPPGERGLVSRALRQRYLGIGGGHRIRLWPKLMEDWNRATSEHYPATVGATGRSPATKPAASNAGDLPVAPTSLASIPEPQNGKPGWESYGVPPGFWVSERLPVAVVQPLAGKYENREQHVAAHYRASGHPTVAAGDITQLLGVQARARTAVVNAAMLPTMLATADFTEAAVARLLPGVPLQVVRSDGGAMTIAEMRRQPILSLLSGPAAGASAALHRSGLSDAVFIEVGGTSTDITLIKDGRVRHRYATVGGQRLMVPALDLRTVAVGGGSMLRADKALFGPRSAHIAGLPYVFQAVQRGLQVVAAETWKDDDAVVPYTVCRMSDGSLAALTLTDFNMSQRGSAQAVAEEFSVRLGSDEYQALLAAGAFAGGLNATAAQGSKDELLKAATDGIAKVTRAYVETCKVVADEIAALAKDSGHSLANATLLGGGGGAPAIADTVGLFFSKAAAKPAPEKTGLIADHSVISAIGAALAVTCVSLSRNVAQPSGSDIAELISEVEGRLAAQGAERVQTDYEFDPRRQVLTVTGRGSRPYEQDTQVRSEDELRDIAQSVLKADPALKWNDGGTWLWAADINKTGRRGITQLACATDRFGRVLWLGNMSALEAAAPGRVTETLEAVVARHTQHTDGGAVLPQLGLLTGGHYIPLDQLGSAELITEVLRWEKLPAEAQGCFVVGKP